MIEKTTAYKVGEKMFSCIEEAQQEELVNLFNVQDPAADWSVNEIAGIILNNAERVMDILTMTPNAKPKARAINGGRKPRKAKPAVEPQPEPQP